MRASWLGLPSSKPNSGAHDRDRTGEPLPYQGSALPTELRGPMCKRLIRRKRASNVMGEPAVKNSPWGLVRHVNSQRSLTPRVVQATMTRCLPATISYMDHLTWWRGEDSNLRRLRRQIYSLLPLAARVPLPIFSVWSEWSHPKRPFNHRELRKARENFMDLPKV